MELLGEGAVAQLEGDVHGHADTPPLGEEQAIGIRGSVVTAGTSKKREYDDRHDPNEGPGLRGHPAEVTLARMDHRQRLMELLVERSVRVGDFTLASGARSSYYVDARRTTMCAEGQFLVGHVAFALLGQRGWNPTHVGGLTMGADPVAYAIAHRSWLEASPLDAFSVRKKAKEHGTGQRIEGGLPEGARCILVEDSMTTGSSALNAAEAIRAHGAEIVGVFTLVDRQEGGVERLSAQGLPLLAAFTGAELLAGARSR